MKEKEIETYLRTRISSFGGRAYKFISPGNDGVPDRLVCLPGGRVIFVELKTTGGKLRPLQAVQIHRLPALGFPVLIINSKNQVDELMKSLGGDAP